MNTAEYLNTLIECKEDMKAAIEERGVTVTGGLSTYADAITSINGAYPIPNKFDINTKFSYSDIVIMPSIDTTGWTSTVEMFDSCNKMREVGWFDTSNVTSFERMFLSCSELENVPLYNSEKVTNMYLFLAGCVNLNNLPNFLTINVTTMRQAFQSLRKITEIPPFVTSNVKDMNGAFAGCSSLNTIPRMDAKQWKDVGDMFYGCASITNVGGFIGLGKEKDLVGADTMFNWRDEVDLSHNQAVNIINDLYDRTSAGYSILEIYIPSRNITEDDIAIATNKGWIVDYYD